MEKCDTTREISKPNDEPKKRAEPETRAVFKIRTNLRAGSKEGSVAPKE
jgi:hypothetical protein